MKVKKCVSEKHSLSLTGPPNSFHFNLGFAEVRSNLSTRPVPRLPKSSTSTHPSKEENSAAPHPTPSRPFPHTVGKLRDTPRFL